MNDKVSPASTGGQPCPICGKPGIKECRPFCSKRCADVDLNRWLSGRYVVPGRDSGTDEDDTPNVPTVPDDDT